MKIENLPPSCQTVSRLGATWRGLSIAKIMNQVEFEAEDKITLKISESGTRVEIHFVDLNQNNDFLSFTLSRAREVAQAIDELAADAQAALDRVHFVSNEKEQCKPAPKKEVI